MMKKFTYLLCGLFGLTAYAAPSQPATGSLLNYSGAPSVVADASDLWDTGNLVNAAEMQAPAGQTAKRKTVRKEGEATENNYFAATQSYMRDQKFVYQGGVVRAYDMSVVRDGNVVKFNKLFDFEGLSTVFNKGRDEEILGTYDPEAKTITIPTDASYAYGTIAGYIGDWCTCTLLGGKATPEGQFKKASELVFQVHGDFEYLSTDQDIALISFYPDGSVLGMQDVYRQFHVYLSQEKPQLLSFDSEITLNKNYVGTESLTAWSVINVSNQPVDYVVSGMGDDCISFASEFGQLPPRSISNVDFKFTPTAAGNYTYEGALEYDSEDADALFVTAKAEALTPPDFSAIQKGDAFDLVTYIDYPAEMQNVDGVDLARISTYGAKNAMSKLQAKLHVPDGSTAKFSWKAENQNPGQAHYAAGGVLIYDNGTEVLGALSYGNENIDGSYEFGPGDHIVSFQYEQITKVVGGAGYGMNVYEMNFEITGAPTDAQELVTSEVNFGGFMLSESSTVAEGSQIIKLRNMGTNPLSVISVSSDNAAFIPTKPSTAVELYQTLDLPVLFSATAVGKYNANITVTTNGGTVVVPVRAVVRVQDDFTQIITAGKELITSITTDGTTPFVLENGVAVNSNHGEPDASDKVTEAISWIQFDFEVPEGQAATLAWEGYSYGNSPDLTQYWLGDKSNVDIKHDNNLYSKEIWGEGSASSADNWYEGIWLDNLLCGPGKHFIRFTYTKNGDGIISEKDRLELYSLSLTLAAKEEYAAELETTEVEFPSTYVGPKRAKVMFVKVTSKGSLPLVFTGEMISDGPFEGACSTWPITYNQSAYVGVYFDPKEEGVYEGSVTFKTNAGDLVVKCKGATKPAAGLALIGDFEDGGYGWTQFDQDADLDCWMPLTTMFYDATREMAHSGGECYASGSIDKTGTKPITPDNWLISPVVNVPAEGAILDWWVAAHNPTFNAENYSIYVLTPEQIKDHMQMQYGDCVYTETLAASMKNNWQNRQFDLADYAGKSVHIAVRHHDCTGQYVFKVDDVFVRSAANDPGAVGTVAGDALVVATEYYDATGMRLAAPAVGVNILRTTYSDGTVKSRKVVVK